jgi:hypothetical protein
LQLFFAPIKQALVPLAWQASNVLGSMSPPLTAPQHALDKTHEPKKTAVVCCSPIGMKSTNSNWVQILDCSVNHAAFENCCGLAS